MTRLPLLGPAAFLLALWLSPAAAHASLALNIGPHSSPNEPDAHYVTPAGLPAGRQFFDLVFEERQFQENEMLFAYDIALRLVPPPGAPAGGVRLDGMERPPDRFVLDVPSGSTFSLQQNRPDYVLGSFSSLNDLADIATGMTAARVYYTIDPNRIAPGDYRIEFDTANTVFGSGDPNDTRPGLPVTLQDSGLIRYTLPEPTGLPLLLSMAALASRRRDRRGAAKARIPLHGSDR